ncbi:MAG: glutathione S-transferase N-terminal domain-containing protein [Pseudomonadota bacterium]
MANAVSKRAVMTLFSDPRSSYSHRVRIVLAEKGIVAEMIQVSPPKIPDELMDMNPYGTLPTLVDRDIKLFESRIIMEYLDERFPHPPLLPVDPISRASARQLMYRVDKDWSSLADQIQAGRKEAASRARKELKESLLTTASVFEAKPFFMSDEFSLVDCCIAPLLWRLPLLGIELPPVAKSVKDYARRIFERECFALSLTEMEREMRT